MIVAKTDTILLENTSPDTGGAIEDPKTPEEWRLAGIEYRKQQEYDKAIEAHTKAIELDPSFARAYSNRGNVHYERGNFYSAIADFTRAIELYPGAGQLPKEGTYYYNRGLVYQAYHDDKAIEDFKKALELNPGDINTKRGLYQYKYGHGKDFDEDETEDIRSLIAEFDLIAEGKDADTGSRAKALQQKSFFLTYLKRYDAAIASINRAIDLENSLALLTDRAWLYVTVQDYDVAMADVDQILRAVPDANVYYLQASISRKKGDREKAVSAY